MPRHQQTLQLRTDGAPLSAYERARLATIGANQLVLQSLGLDRPLGATTTKRRRPAAASEPATASRRRATHRRSAASPRRYDTLHLFGHDVAAWPLEGVSAEHKRPLLYVRLVLRGCARPNFAPAATVRAVGAALHGHDEAHAVPGAPSHSVGARPLAMLPFPPAGGDDASAAAAQFVNAQYTEVITAALLSLRERDGSTLASIRRYAQTHCPAANSAPPLKTAIKIGLARGTLVALRSGRGQDVKYKLIAEAENDGPIVEL